MLQIASQKDILEFYQQKFSNRKRKIYAFYNSLLNKIIFDQKYMLIPIDDRIAVRGHGSFDVIYVKHKSIINLEPHIDRLFDSAKTIQIIPKQTKQQVKVIILELIKNVFKKYIEDNGPNAEQLLQNTTFGIRITFSSGFGDFGISSIDKQPIFYAVVFQPYIDSSVQQKGVNDYVVKFVKQISNETIHAKTTNYLQNAMMANESKRKGGYVGIKAFDSGILLQASIANIAFIFGKQFATPRFQTVIKGTTLTNLLKYLQILKEQEIIQKISFRDITIDQAYKADQMIIIGGDKIVPVLNLDDQPIGNQQIGKLTKMFQKWYAETNFKLFPIKY